MFRGCGLQFTLAIFAWIACPYCLFAWEEVYVNFDGSAYLTYGLFSKISTSSDNFKFLFRTIKPSGVILHAGSATDFITLELLRGKLRYTANFGTTANKSGFHEVYMGNHLADNEWHQVELHRTGLYIRLILDVTRENIVAPGSYDTLDLDGRIYIAGVDNVGLRDAQIRHQRKLPFTKFEGCLQDVILNGKNILKMARNHDISTQLHGGAAFGCPLPVYKPITFTHPKSHILLPVTQSSALRLRFRFRTYDAGGMLLIHRIQTLRGANVFVSLVGGRVKMEVVFPNPRKKVRLQAGSELNDGLWHLLSLSVSGSAVSLTADQEVDHVTITSRDFAHNSVLHIGGSGSDLAGFVGCMYDISVNGHAVNISMATTSNILIGRCTPVDHCWPNPCSNRGRCTQRLNETSCDCAGTTHRGQRCDVPAELFKETCADWKAAGKTANGYYKISPGDIKPFMVYCNMTNPGGVTTVIDHLWGRSPVRAMNSRLRKHGYYLHTTQYEQDRASITALISRSTHCRQYLRYNCFNSVLFDSPHDFDLTSGRGARWMSRDNDIMDYWAGATPGSHKCACALTNTCVRHDLVCNCDAWDSVWRSDGGYITDLNSLPVKKVMFNVRGTSASSNYTLGSLECFGSKNRFRTTQPATHRPMTGAQSVTPKTPRTASDRPVIPPKTDFTPTWTHKDGPTTQTNNNVPDAIPTSSRDDNDGIPTTKSDIDYNNPPPVIIVDSPRKYITIRQNSNQELILIILSIVLALFIIAIIVLMLRQNLFMPCKCLDGPVYRDVRNIDSVELGPPSSMFTNVDTEIVQYEASPFPQRDYSVGYPYREEIVVPSGISRDPDSDEETERLDFSNDSSSPSDSQDGKEGMERKESTEYEHLEMALLKSPQRIVDEVQIHKLKEALCDVIAAEVNINNNPITKETIQTDIETTEYESQPGNTIDRYGMDFLRPPPYPDIDRSITHAQRSDSELSTELSTRTSDSCSCDELSVDEVESPSSSDAIPRESDKSDLYPRYEGNAGDIHLNTGQEDENFKRRSRHLVDMQYYCSYEPEDACADMRNEDAAFLEAPSKRTHARCEPVRPEQQALLSEVPDEGRGCDTCDEGRGCDTCGEGCDCATCERSTSDYQSSNSSGVTSDICSCCSMNECECDTSTAGRLITRIDCSNHGNEAQRKFETSL